MNRNDSRRLYRARDGMIMGVCTGLARHLGVGAWVVRAVAVVLLFATGVWPMVGLYFLAGLIMKPEPVLPLQDEDEREFYESYASSRPMALARLQRKFQALDRRIQRMEHVVTSRDFDWRRRFSE